MTAVGHDRAPRGEHTRCARCGTELSPYALACPACKALVHADELKTLAAAARELDEGGSLAEARATWERALALLPPGSQQHTAVRERVVDLNRRIDAASAATGVKPAGADGEATSWWKKGGAVAITLALLLGGKLKFLLLGLTKLKTFVSMFAFFGWYWNAFGWPLALGLVISIYIHEMGHVAMLKRLGIDAGAPLFIPGVGALVMLKQHIDDPVVDAKIGLAGPVWGLGAGLAAFAVYVATDAPIWAAIAQLTGFINLFNLIPVWQLDGSRGFHALAREERWLVVATLAAAYWITGQKLLILIAAVAVWRAFQKVAGAGHRPTLATFILLIASLSALAALDARDVVGAPAPDASAER